jgi:hypothetical protein
MEKCIPSNRSISSRRGDAEARINRRRAIAILSVSNLCRLLQATRQPLPYHRKGGR